MPRKSRKRELEDQLLHLWQLRMLAKTMRIASGEQSIVEDTTDDVYFVLYHKIKQSRYISRCTYRTGLSATLFQFDLQSSDDETGVRPFLNHGEFLQKYRMSRETFSKLVSLIEHHPVFHADNGPKQAPPAFQLMVLLKYLGTEGSGGSNPDLRSVFRTGRGTNDLFKSRAIKAIRSIRDVYYTWPGVEEREKISARIQRGFDIPNCVGFADGTLNPLGSKPQREDSADYYGRKHGYSLSTLVICDDKRLIRYFLAGWPGSCHDNRIYRHSMPAASAATFFSNKEFLLGDSAFEASDIMVPPFKKPNGCNLRREYENFNGCHSSARVISEHAIGIWKARFPWLRNIRMTITEQQRSIRLILYVIECTVILHNFLLLEKEPEIPPDWLDENDTVHLHPNDELNRTIPAGAPKSTRQMQVMNYINEIRH